MKTLLTLSLLLIAGVSYGQEVKDTKVYEQYGNHIKVSDASGNFLYWLKTITSEYAPKLNKSDSNNWLEKLRRQKENIDALPATPTEVITWNTGQYNIGNKAYSIKSKPTEE